jgi:two-component system, OmpR family, phosphate regulon sensor histidine kinase PhoR
MDQGLLVLLMLLGLGLAAAVVSCRRQARFQPPPVVGKDGESQSESDLPPLFVALASALDDGLLVVEHDRRISFANLAVSQLLGAAGGALRGQTFMTGLRDFEADQAVERALETGEAQSTVLQSARTGRTLRLTCQPVPGRAVRGLVVIRDMTQLTHLERARREMVANVSHELRTPLASVRLLVETLETEPPPPVARRMLGQIEDELQAMMQLIDELSELSQIESGRLVLRVEPVAVEDLAARALERLRTQAERRGLRIDVEPVAGLPRVLVDEGRMGQVFANLLHNAIKWTPAGGTITIRAVPATPPPDERTARELQYVDGADWVKVSVEDTGIGIPAGETERIFERFYKVDRARTREAGGTGLGLAIAKHLVERHGGRIWAESREGQGSTFSMLLPVA